MLAANRITAPISPSRTGAAATRVGAGAAHPDHDPLSEQFRVGGRDRGGAARRPAGAACSSAARCIAGAAGAPGAPGDTGCPGAASISARTATSPATALPRTPTARQSSIIFSSPSEAWSRIQQRAADHLGALDLPGDLRLLRGSGRRQELDRGAGGRRADLHVGLPDLDDAAVRRCGCRRRGSCGGRRCVPWPMALAPPRRRRTRAWPSSRIPPGRPRRARTPLTILTEDIRPEGRGSAPDVAGDPPLDWPADDRVRRPQRAAPEDGRDRRSPR